MCINEMCDAMIQSCVAACDETIPRVKKKGGIPMWDEMAKPFRETAMFWHSIWISCNKPTSGAVHDIRRKTRADYHRAVKSLKCNKTANRCEKMAESVLKNDSRNFWKESRKMKGKVKKLPDTMDGVTGGKEIADLFGTKYDRLYNSVPFDVSVMNDIEMEVNKRILHGDESNICVSVEDVRKAISSLNDGKSDGCDKIESDHIINGSAMLYKMLCLLIQKCFDHGYMPDSLNVATIVSIPKDNRGSMIKSDNYRGIGLCSSIVKVMDIIMYNSSDGTLNTSGLQFAYKSEHSTTMCTAMMKEVVRHYKKNGSQVYCCLLDASKAFDRIRLDKLFKILLDRKFPAGYIKFLMNSYVNQDIRVKWGNNLSHSFKGINGVRQGGVISPILFTVYIDILIERLEKCNAGCWIGHKFVGCAGYADDVKLLSPSVTGLQIMVNVCEEFGIEYDLLFNEKKSVCMMFDHQQHYPDIMLNGRNLCWQNKAKHVGNVINNVLTDEDDILLKTQDFFQQVNQLMADYGSLRFDILKELFSKKCNSFYGSQMWDLRSKYVQSLLRAWNRAARRVLKLPFNSHRYLLPVLLNMQPLHVQLCRRFLNMCHTMCRSKNKTVAFVFKHCVNDKTSCIARNLFYISESYQCNTKSIVEMKKMVMLNINDEQKRTCVFLNELLDVRDGKMNVEGMDKSQIQDIIEYVSTC